ncbi:TPA: glycosyltransferase family 4 protein [Clostridium perfringens]|uniref:glycosyltransferase family 4 protein n=1 Tax=Clostridium perfringens TaxID=1502 RepID=UPI001A1FCE06|nr:glycosyltransferase family 4 protein [Clostridium perfringens]
MKIAMIGQKGIPSRAGGVEIHVEEIAKRLVENGDEVTVYCREGYCEKKYENYNGINIKYIKSINTKHLDAITYTFLATINAIKNDYDIIQYHALGPSMLSFIPRIFKKKVVSTVHGLDWQRDKWGIIAKTALKFGEYATAKFPNKTITVSKSSVEYYKEKYHKDIIYIPNGIDKKRKIEPNIINKEFGLNKNGYILFLARLVPEKGVHHLIEAYKNIKTDKKLVIAGGSSHSDDYVKELKKISGDNNNIIFTGFVTGDIIDELFFNAYTYVLPSEIEGLPISLLEAMAYGQCCLVSDIEENIDVIGEYGVSFKNKSVDSLTDKLNFLLNTPNKVNELKKSSEEYILNKYNWNKIAEETIGLFKSI